MWQYNRSIKRNVQTVNSHAATCTLKFTLKDDIDIIASVLGVKNPQNFLVLWLMVKMPWLSKNDRECATGMLESGRYQTNVVQRFGVHRTTISRLWDRFTTTGSTDDRTQPGQHRITTPRQERYIRYIHMREYFWFATIKAWTFPGQRRVSAQTIWNRLRSYSKASIQRTNSHCQS